MAIKEWSTDYSGANPTQDPDPITGKMPDLAEETSPGANDGDAQRSSQVQAPRDKLQTACKYVGDSANNPADSLHAIIDKDHTEGAATQLRLYKRTAKPTNATDTGFIYALSSDGYLDLMWENPDGSETNLVDGGISVGYDEDAVHVDGLGEIDGVSAKPSPIGADVVLIEDSTSSWAKKKIALSDIPGVSPLTTKGDLFGFDTDNERIPVGADGYVLTADSGESLGVKWAEATGSSPLTTKGDLFGFDTDNERIPVGADGYVLTADSGESLGVKWAEATGGGSFSGYEEEYTAAGGDENFTLSATPATNANMLSGVNIIGVYRNGQRLRYRGAPATGLEYGYSAPTTIVCKSLDASDIITVVYSI